MADGFEWYVSQDQEHWTIASADTRDEAIDAGRENYGEEGFYICEAKKQDFPYRRMFHLDRMFENMIDDDWGEVWGEDQDSIFASKVTSEQVKDLEAMLIETFKAWVAKHDVKLETPWVFGATRNEEYIDPIPEAPEAA